VKCREPAITSRYSVENSRILTVLPDFPLPATTGLHLRMVANLKALTALDLESHVLWFSTPRRRCGEVDLDEIGQLVSGIRHGGQRVEQHELSPLRRLLSKVRFVSMGLSGRPRTSYPYSIRYDAIDGAEVLRTEAKRLKPDAVILPSQLMHWCEVLDPSVTVVIDAADVLTDVTAHLASTSHTGRLRRLGLWANHLGCRAQERRYFDRADEVWLTTAAEADRCRALVPSATAVVVPNAVPAARSASVERCQQDPINRSFGMIATWSYLPNLNAAMYLIDQVLPLVVARCPEAQLVLAGSGLPAELERRCQQHDSIKHMGEIDHVPEFYAACAVVAIPIKVRGGVPLKLAEAMAYARPVVASPQLVQGLSLVDGVDLIVGAEPDDIASAIVRLFEDEEVYESIVAGGLRAHDRHFSLVRVANAVRHESRLGR